MKTLVLLPALLCNEGLFSPQITALKDRANIVVPDLSRDTDLAAASEILFDAKIDAIRRTFRTSPLKSADDTGFGQVVSSHPVMFCGILCHAAELTMQTVSYADIEADPDFDLADWLTCKTDYEAGLTAEDIIELGGTDAGED